MTYEEFLAAKHITAPSHGFEPDLARLAASPLFPFQQAITGWACRRGRAAVFADTGLGKTFIQLEWARQVREHTGGDVLILAPLAVADQTAGLAKAELGIDVTVCRTYDDVRPGLNITNYDQWRHFPAGQFAGLVLDESSLLKGDGPMRKWIVEFGREVPYRLACTATPAPNDTDELINHAEFLGIMRGTEILALFFTQDGNTTHSWRLKGHAREAFWTWMASWAVALRKPSDMGYSDEGFILPELILEQHCVEAAMPQDALFQVEAHGIHEQRRVRRETMSTRVALAAEMVNSDLQPWLVWCDLNDESRALTEAIPGAVEVTGTQPPHVKAQRLLAFARGEIRVLVTKPEIAGFGMNFQHCARQAFVGLGNSYEKYYQAIRRCWRFGQKRPVECHVIVSEADGPVVRNIERKEKQAKEMMDELVKRISTNSLEQAGREDMHYEETRALGHAWTLYLGDCVEQMANVEDESVGLSIFSPPFPSMYAYTNSPRDMGNATSFDEMLDHFRFLLPELLRATKPGRTCAIHLTQAVAFKSKDGHCGMKDFRGATIAMMQDAGWIYYGEATIDKNPQLKAIRTKDRGLLFKTLATDASHMHMALADYLLQFRKPGDNEEPIRAGISDKYGNLNGWITQDQWIRWARPVWYAADFVPEGGDTGINETDVLNCLMARENDDERHLCPLQLGVIERAIKLWSNPGDLVLSPFAGIGSEGYQSVLLGRRFLGIELKRSYFEIARRNLESAEIQAGQPTLFDVAELWADDPKEAATV